MRTAPNCPVIANKPFAVSELNQEKGVDVEQGGKASSAAVGVHKEAPLGLRTVAMFEFGKGVLFLMLGLGALSFEHRDIAKAADILIQRLHLDPTWHYSELLITSVSKLTAVRLQWIGIVGLTLSAVRIAEGYFLWRQNAWAEWLAVVSSSIYLPLEIYHFYHRPSVFGAGVFLVNLIIVIYLAVLLNTNRKEKKMESKTHGTES